MGDGRSGPFLTCCSTSTRQLMWPCPCLPQQEIRYNAEAAPSCLPQHQSEKALLSVSGASVQPQYDKSDKFICRRHSPPDPTKRPQSTPLEVLDDHDRALAVGHDVVRHRAKEELADGALVVRAHDDAAGVQLGG
eukprot:241979-Chlamydomonas_euryale.AAC.6